jgi:phosphatidylserine decarboxylase
MVTIVPAIFITSVLIALVITNFVAKKGYLGKKIGIGGGLAVGIVSGFITTSIYVLAGGLNFFIVGVIEILVIIFVGASGILLFFYRDPERIPPDKDGIIVSPADGFVRYVRRFERGCVPEAIKGKKNITIKEIAKTDFTDNGGYIIGITMRIIDVHVNRAPISGKVVFQKHTNGKFSSLKSPESDTMNERNTIIIDTGHLKIGVVQIASRTVRKIESYIHVGEDIEIGQRIGMIKYGSQADLILPGIKGLRITVKEGEQVYGGKSIIADYSSNNVGSNN